ncbi:tunicamycin resistance protein, partial [Gonapodya sp. JEL0774]
MGYYVGMSLLCVFFTNSINLVAGINGVEVATSLVIGISVLINDAMYLVPGATVDARAIASHSFSSYMLLPFVG